jgi:hypothetical protein
VITVLNIVLVFSTIVLVGYVFSNLRKPYYPVSSTAKALRAEQFELTDSESPVPAGSMLEFKEDIFKRKQLFNFSTKKNKELEIKEFILLGASMGEKNLAMIRDAKENKDYYCKEGDNVGVYKVKQIFKDKVIFESEGNILVITQ